MPIRLGRGHCAVVYRSTDAQGREVASKVFVPGAASRLVFLAIEGARNPYGWCRAAVEAAVLRRKILERLVPYWFGTSLRLPATHGYRWNARHKAFELTMELVRGRHLPLRRPTVPPGTDLLPHLVKGIMEPLQAKLEESGFDGLVWQAGRGNPVAAGNFLLESALPSGLRWVWVDLESGVPALFALSPRAWLDFYLPRMLARRRPLFDDVDTHRLRQYLERERADLDALLGPSTTGRLLSDVDQLERSQSEWKSLSRLDRSLLAAVASGRLSRSDAVAYRRRPLPWHVRTMREEVVGGIVAIRGRAHGFARRVRRFRWKRLVAGIARFVRSERFRAALARRYAAGRIRSWRARDAIGPWEEEQLLGELRRYDTSAYITDFGVHLMVKPLVKFLQWVVLPILFVMGVTSGVATAVLLLIGGPIVRTLYTSGRMVQAAARGHRLPWVALAIGTLPVAGNVAYPAELVTSSLGRRNSVARLLLYDAFAAVGRAVPIWGGAHTLTEHRACRLPARVVERLLRAEHVASAAASEGVVKARVPPPPCPSHVPARQRLPEHASR